MQALPKRRSVRRGWERKRQHSEGVAVLAGSDEEPSTAQHNKEHTHTQIHRVIRCIFQYNYVHHLDKSRERIVPWIFGTFALMIKKSDVILPFISFVSSVKPHLWGSFRYMTTEDIGRETNVYFQVLKLLSKLIVFAEGTPSEKGNMSLEYVWGRQLLNSVAECLTYGSQCLVFILGHTALWRNSQVLRCNVSCNI